MAEETLAYRAIARVDRQGRAVKGFLGPDVRLVVLPEYFLTGCPLRESIPEWADKPSLDPDGAEYEALAKIAEDDAMYLSGNVYETATWSATVSTWPRAPVRSRTGHT